MMMRKGSSLVDLCIYKAIDNIEYIGDVGDTADHLLERILSHCTLDELRDIENSTKGRDLSPATDKLWKRFYKKDFGEKRFNNILERMRLEKVTFKWRQLYEARDQEIVDAVRKCGDRCKEKEKAKKAPIILPLTELPPWGTKRSYWGGAISDNINNTKSSTMKKTKVEYYNSREVMNRAVQKNKVVVQRNHHGLPSEAKLALSSGLDTSSSSSSSNKLSNPFSIGS